MESFDTVPESFDFETSCGLFDAALEKAARADRDEPASQLPQDMTAPKPRPQPIGCATLTWGPTRKTPQ